MRILALDPGPELTAAVLWDGLSIEWAQYGPNLDILDLFAALAFDCIVCEHLECFGMAVGKETFESAYWIGHFRAVAMSMDKPFHRIYRHQEKIQICGNVKSNDSNIRQALIDMIGPQWLPGIQTGKKKPKRIPGPTSLISGDLWSALAVAVTFVKLHENSTQTVVDRKDGEGIPVLHDAHG